MSKQKRMPRVVYGKRVGAETGASNPESGITQTTYMISKSCQAPEFVLIE